MAYADLEKKRETERVWRLKNRDAINARRRAKRTDLSVEQKKEYDRKRYLQDRERVSEWGRRRRQKAKAENPELYARTCKDKMLKYKYKLSLEQYEQLLCEQKNLCALCQKPMQLTGPMSYDHAVIEHNHETGKVRGIVHSRCNVLISSFDSDPLLLARLTQYLA